MIFTIRAFVTFITIIDPVGLAPVVIALTAHLSDAQRSIIITRAIIISAIIITFFALVGNFLLERLGISLYAFNMAGGILLLLVAIDMLFGRSSGARETKTESDEAMTREDVSVFPLAIPMIAGPGTIATTILYVNLATASGNAFDILSVGAAIATALVAAWLVMRSSLWIIHHVGRTGILVLSRILGILLAALAIQFVLNGIVQFVHVSGFGK